MSPRHDRNRQVHRTKTRATRVLAGGALWYTLTAHRRYRLQRRASSAMNSLLHDNLSGIRQIKSFVRGGKPSAW